ncbi:MAG TPA: AAA family ATPase, partial [Elusimicrobiota bacterium]|nr:AAA family ATPase [Elusimicrobiota bacterium]
PAADLRLGATDEEAVAAFTQELHTAVAAKFPGYAFTVRDYYAWVNFLRHFTPSLGIKEALRQGAAYVYGDRLESEAELKDFKTLLADSVKRLGLAQPEHGKDAAKAEELRRLAEPPPDFVEDESSPFQLPLSALVPDPVRSDLVLTPTTLRRIEAGQQAFAMRDYALLLGPPATTKSAIPKYLAAQHKIPYLAVTMHPGIGTFELVGGYRPKVVEIRSLDEARRIVRAALAAARSRDEYSELLDSAAKVYGGSALADVLGKIERDLGGPDSQELRRRLLTLAHGLEYGAASLVWQDGYLTYALKRDIWINFEEINAAPTESQEFLNDFMRTRRLVVTQKLGEPEVLSPKPGGRFMLWATMNPETDPNREVLAQTLKNRWRVKNFGALPDAEQAEIIEKKYGLPAVWSLALVENFHKELRRQSVSRVIGGQWRDGYEINLRHLLKVARRWKYFMEQETEAKGVRPDRTRQLFLLAREAYSVYGGMMRLPNERAGLFTMLTQALKLDAAGVRDAEALKTRPAVIEDLGDEIRIGDVILPKGRGGPFVPTPNRDYLEDQGVRERLYEYAKALALGEPVLLMGESAAGKTSDLEYLFFKLNKNLRYRNLDSDTAIEEVVGGYAPGERRGQFVYQEGLLPRAMEENSGAFLDEFNLNPLVEWLNTVVDDGRLYLPHRIVDGHPMLVAAANPPEPRYPGRVLLSPATRSRYTELWVPLDASPARLKGLMRHWLRGGTIYGLLLLAAQLFASGAGLNALPARAFGVSLPNPIDWLRRLFGSKKKAPEEGEELALPPSLEDLLKSRGIAEAEWPKYREKVARVQAQMRMVGSSVAQDADLEWVPGEIWAKFLDKKTATYPLESLITHSEEQLIGVIDHESLHQEATVLDERLPLVRKYLEDPHKHFLWNAFEDPRINSRGVHRLPGSERFLHALYDRYLPEDLVLPEGAKGESSPTPEGDGGTAFNPKSLEFPHIEFLFAANYYWRYGKKPPRFRNRSAEEAFDKALPAIPGIFGAFPRGNSPAQEEKLAYTLDALRRIDESILPLYEPLIKESEQKRSKGKGKGSPKPSQGSGTPQPGTPPPQGKPQQKPGGQGGQGEQGEAKPGGEGDQPADPKDLARARRELQDQAREGAEELGGKIRNNPTRPAGSRDRGKDTDKGKKPSGPAAESPQKPGDAEPEPLTLEDVAQTRRDQILNREATPWQRAFEPVAHLSNVMVTHLENIFQKNSRPRDVGWWKRGKRPDVRRYMKLQGEGAVRDDVMLRRAQKTKRRYKITLLVDASGSVANVRTEIIRTVVLMLDALSRLQIDVEVILFSNVARVVKEFKEPLSPEAKERVVADLQDLLANLGNGNTWDADALTLAVERIRKEDAEKRFVFVVTDGAGNGPSNVASVFPKADQAGVYVMGVGVGAGMAYVKSVYPRHAVPDSLEGLPALLKTRLEEYVSGIETAAGAQASGKAVRWWAALPSPAAAAARADDWLLRARAWAARLPGLWILLFALTASAAFAIMHVLAPLALPVAATILLAAAIGAAAVALGLKGYNHAVMPLFAALLAVLLSGVVSGSEQFAWALGLGGLSLAFGRDSIKALWAPLPAAVSERLLAARPDLSALADPKRARRLRSWAGGLVSIEPIRKATLARMAGKPDALLLLPMLEILGTRDPSIWVRSKVGDLLGTLLPDSKAIKLLKELIAADVMLSGTAAYLAGRLQEAERQQAEAAEQSRRLDELTALARAAPAQTPRSELLARARTALEASPQASLTERLRRGALGEAIRALEEAPDPAASAIAAKRLEELLNPAGAASALNALPIGNVLRGLSWRQVAIVAALPLFLAALLAAPLWAAYLLAAASSIFWMWLGFRYRKSGADPLPLGLVLMGLLPLIALANMSAGVLPFFFFIAALVAASILLLIQRHQRVPLGLGLRWKLGKLRAQAALEASGRPDEDVLLRWADELSAFRPDALRALTSMSEDFQVQRRLTPALEAMLELLRGEGPEELRAAASAAIDNRARFTQKAEDEAQKAAAALRAAASREAEPSRLLAERADAFLAGPAPTSLSSRLRQAAVREGLGALRAAEASGDRSAAALAAERLERQLEEAASRRLPFALALHALPSARDVWTTLLPALVAGAIILLFNAVALGLGLLIAPFFAGSSGTFLIVLAASGFAALTVPARGATTLLQRARILLFFGLLFGSMQVAMLRAGLPLLGMLGADIFALSVTGPAADKRLRQKLGILPWETLRELGEARAGASLDGQGAGWWDALAGTAKARRRALREMLLEPKAARRLLPAAAILLERDDPGTNAELIALATAWGDGESEAILRPVAQSLFHSARADAERALDDIARRREEAGRLQKLADSVKVPAPAAEPGVLLARGRDALAAMGEPATLAARLRKSALSRAIEDVTAAGDADSRAVAESRLRELLAPRMALALAALHALPPGPFPGPSLARRAKSAFENHLPFFAVYAPVATGGILFYTVGLGAAITIAAPLFIASVASFLIYSFLRPFRHPLPYMVSPELELRASTELLALPPDVRRSLAAELDRAMPATWGKQSTRSVRNPLQYLLHDQHALRRLAWRTAWPLMKPRPVPTSNLLGALVRTYAKADFSPRPKPDMAEEIDYLAQLGEPGRGELRALAQSDLDRGAHSRAAEALARLEGDLPVELEAMAAAIPEQPASYAPLLARGRAALAAEPVGLLQRLRHGALSAAVDDLEAELAAGQDGAAAIAARRLEELLAPRAGFFLALHGLPGRSFLAKAAALPWERLATWAGMAAMSLAFFLGYPVIYSNQALVIATMITAAVAAVLLRRTRWGLPLLFANVLGVIFSMINWSLFLAPTAAAIICVDSWEFLGAQSLGMLARLWNRQPAMPAND